MTDRNDEESRDPRIAEHGAAAVSRRRFLAGRAVAVFSGGVLLAACGGDDDGGGGSATGRRRRRGRGPAELLPLGRVRRSGAVRAVHRGVRRRDQDRHLRLERGGDRQARAARRAPPGYDIVVPTGVFIPQMVENDLLEELDLGKIPNFSNIETVYTNQPWDPGNAHSVCKDWGSTGWIIDKSADLDADRHVAGLHRRRDGRGERQRLGARRAERARRHVLLGERHRLDDRGSRPTSTRTRTFMVNELAPHIKAFDSYPGIALTQGNYALSQVWNGDARQGLLAVDDPDQYKWGLGAPETELWMDNWCIVKGARAPRGGLRLDQLHPRPGELAEGPRVPRLQHRDQGRRRKRRARRASRSSTWCSSPTSRSRRSGPAR